MPQRDLKHKQYNHHQRFNAKRGLTVVGNALPAAGELVGMLRPDVFFALVVISHCASDGLEGKV